MIITGIINLAYYLLFFIVDNIPMSTGYPSEVGEAIAYIGGYMTIWDFILPTGTVLVCMLIVFSTELGIWSFKGVKWIVSHLPWIGGKG